MSLRTLSAALALGIGLAGAAVGIAPAAMADDAATVHLALAVPLTVRENSTGLIAAEDLETYTGPSGLLTRELAAVADRPVAIGIDPMIIASIRVLGSSAPASATAWLDRLEAVPNETFSLTYADTDLTLSTQAGGSQILQPESFDFAMDPALIGADSSATPTPTPADSALPSAEQLLDWPYTLSGIAWPRDDTVVAADLPIIAASGYTTTILSSGNLDRTGGGSAAQVGDSRVLVSDATVSGALRGAAGAFGPDEWGPAVTVLSGSVAAMGPGATVFATLDRGTAVHGIRLSDTLDAIQADPAITLVGMSAASAAEPSPATVVDEPQPSGRISQAGQLLEAESAERRFATVAADPARITDDRRLRLLGVLSNAWISNLTGWPDAAAGYIADSVTLRNSVQLVKSSDFLLWADFDQRLPITVKNDLDQPVTVYVTVRPSNALLAIDNSRMQFELDPASQAKVDIPVRSLSNGVVDIEVTLTDSAGTLIGSPLHNEVNVQAGWETPIVIAIAGLVIVVFAVGIVRTVLRRRRNADD